MIQEFVDAFMVAEGDVRKKLAEEHPYHYTDLVRLVVEAINPEGEYGLPDKERIHVIDDGDYQGTLVYVIGAVDYQPYSYWYVFVSYGSCSGCDTLQDIRGYEDGPPTAEQVNDYWTLCLHIVQKMKAMENLLG